jgi:hypothetical protein
VGHSSIIIRTSKAQAANLLTALDRAITTMQAADPPTLCLLCDHEFRDAPAAFVVLTGAIEAPRNAIVVGLCACCAAGNDLLDRIAQKYKQSVVRGLRHLPALSEPGRA